MEAGGVIDTTSEVPVPIGGVCFSLPSAGNFTICLQPIASLRRARVHRPKFRGRRIVRTRPRPWIFDIFLMFKSLACGAIFTAVEHANHISPCSSGCVHSSSSPVLKRAAPVCPSRRHVAQIVTHQERRSQHAPTTSIGPSRDAAFPSGLPTLMGGLSHVNSRNGRDGANHWSRGIQPRVSVAYQVSPKWVFRGGAAR